MPRYRFGDIAKEVKVNINRANNPYEFYVAGDHMDTDSLEIRRRGTFANSDVGPAFIRLFEPGQILYGSRRTYLKKVAVADFAGITSNTTFVIEAKDETIFLHRLLSAFAKTLDSQMNQGFFCVTRTFCKMLQKEYKTMIFN